MFEYFITKTSIKSVCLKGASLCVCKFASGTDVVSRVLFSGRNSLELNF